MDGFRIGLIRADFLQNLLAFPDVFSLKQLNDGLSNRLSRPLSFAPLPATQFLTFHSSLQSYEQRSNAINRVLQNLRDNPAFPTLRGWRNEVLVAVAFFDYHFVRSLHELMGVYVMQNYVVTTRDRTRRFFEVERAGARAFLCFCLPTRFSNRIFSLSALQPSLAWCSMGAT